MRLVRFVTNDSPSRPGIMIDDAVVALSDLLSDTPTDMISVIDRWETIKEPLAKRVAERPVSPVRNATLLAPIERPGKILAIGLNYADHIAEAKDAGVKIPTEQVWFCKQPTSVNAPFGGIHKPIISDQLEAAEAGTAVLHLHALDPKDGRHTGSRRLRAIPAPHQRGDRCGRKHHDRRKRSCEPRGAAHRAVARQWLFE